MSALARRLARLEGHADDGAIVWVQAPADWPEQRSRAEAEALAARLGLRPPFSLTIQPRPDAPAVQPVFIGTGSELSALLADVAAHGARIGGQGR